jgi:hypothetical protein
LYINTRTKRKISGKKQTSASVEGLQVDENFQVSSADEKMFFPFIKY